MDNEKDLELEIENDISEQDELEHYGTPDIPEDILGAPVKTLISGMLIFSETMKRLRRKGLRLQRLQSQWA